MRGGTTKFQSIYKINTAKIQELQARIHIISYKGTHEHITHNSFFLLSSACGVRNHRLISRHGLGAFHPISWWSCMPTMQTAPEGPFMCRWWAQALPFGQWSHCTATAAAATVTLWWCGNDELVTMTLRCHGWWWWCWKELQVGWENRMFLYIE